MSIQTLICNSPYWIRQIAINTYGFMLSRKRFSGSFKFYFKEFQNNLSKPPKQIEKEQFDLLKKNLIYCFENIAYYKRVFKENNFDPYKMVSAEELKKIPYLTKDIIKKEFENLYNKEIPKANYKEHFTSGSTGEKLRFLLPKELINKKNTALMYRFYAMAGIKPKDKRVTIGGRRFTNRKPFYAINYFENQLLLSAHHLSDKNISEYIKKINSYKPVFIQGHPSAILVMAKYIQTNNIQLEVSLKAIFTTGETLIADDKHIIEKAFITHVYQQYGSGENSFSAQEAPDEIGYLLNYEHGYVEMIGNEQYKEVYVTSLLNDVMPFVRYKIGDFVLPIEKTHSKEFGLPIIFKEVIGRIDDVLMDGKGNKILPVTIRMSMKPFLVDNTNYQLIQTGHNAFNLNLIDLNKKIKTEEVIKMLQDVLGKGMTLTITYVENLTTLGGKIRNVINQFS
ncbi:acyl-CoA synthetase family protein [Bizionia myxarmorum]|uniref:Phenylacetate--CoA ligase family protein n=1 Tax=Bizionia myxarmorum TaxID=291186 RepID=A0A5D0RBX6_9FLAO|nr:phenylacetate--CoA ligase family protein [Bizionia myxarmorum]TYB79047.1 phenylacetate--CoA ligase family protein [Bizionia myxarmorum]